MKRALAFALIIASSLGILSGVAFASWKASSANAAVSAKAVLLETPAKPTAVVTNANATVSFPGVTRSDGYLVTRYDNLGVGSTVTGCSGTVVITCQDNNLKNGTYSYGVHSLLGNWKSAESTRATATVAMTLPASTFVGPTSKVGPTTWNGLNGTASSPIGIAKVEVSLRNAAGYWNGAAFASPAEVMLPATGAASWSLPAVSLPVDGIYTARILLTDTAGNTRSVDHNFTYDATPAVITFTLPTYVRNSVALSATANEPATFAYAICADFACSNPVMFVGSTWTTDFDGPTHVRVIATDEAGNTSSKVVATTVDKTAPVTSDNSASLIGWTNSARTVSLASSDATSGVATTYYTLDGSTPTISSSKGTSVLVAVEGETVVKYFSVDAAGNAEAVRSSLPIRIDATPPSMATMAALPTYISDGYLFSAAASDARSGVARVEYLACAGTGCTPNTVVATSTIGPDYVVTWNGISSTLHRVKVRVFDNAGNFKDSAISDTTFDNVAPAVTLVEPTIGEVVRGTFNFQATATDAVSGVTEVIWQVRPSGTTAWTNYATDTTATGSSYSASVNTTGVVDGSYDIRVAAIDRSGLTGYSALSSFVIDNDFEASAIQFIDGGGTTGRIQTGDKIVIDFSDRLDVSTLCSDWGSDTVNQTRPVVLRFSNGGSAVDTMAMQSGCGTHSLGSFSLVPTDTSTATTAEDELTSTRRWHGFPQTDG